MISGESIRSARELAGMNQKELADRVGASERTIGNWERGASLPRNKEAKIREVLGPWLNRQKDSLSEVPSMELLAEIARRFVQADELNVIRAQRVVDALPPPTAAELAQHKARKIEILEQLIDNERNHPDGDPDQVKLLEQKLEQERYALAAEHGELEPDDQPAPDDPS